MLYAKWNDGEYRHWSTTVLVSELLPALGGKEVEVMFGMDALQMTRDEARDLGNRLLAAAGVAK